MGWRIKDQGKVPENIPYRKRLIAPIFVGDTSPAKATSALEFFKLESPRTREQIQKKGYRNAVTVLQRFGLVTHEKNIYRLNLEALSPNMNSSETIWNAAKTENTLTAACHYLTSNPHLNGSAIGKMLNTEFNREWTASSEKRIGNSVRQWATWLLYGLKDGEVAKPPGRASESIAQETMDSLFDPRI